MYPSIKFNVKFFRCPFVYSFIDEQSEYRCKILTYFDCYLLSILSGLIGQCIIFLVLHRNHKQGTVESPEMPYGASSLL